MKTIVLEIIKKLTEAKKKAKKAPLLVLDDQIEAEIKALVLEALKSLYKEGSIDLGRTVNNNYARLVTPEEPQQKTVNRKVILHKIK